MPDGPGRTQRRQVKLRRYALGGLAPWLALACREPIPLADCQKLLDHYVELLAASDRDDVSPRDVAQMKAAARSKAARDPYFAECPERVSRRALDCALAAHNPDELERCLL